MRLIDVDDTTEESKELQAHHERLVKWHDNQIEQICAEFQKIPKKVREEPATAKLLEAVLEYAQEKVEQNRFSKSPIEHIEIIARTLQTAVARVRSLNAPPETDHDPTMI